MSKANLIQARGLVTYSNELIVPDGSLKVANNVNIDEPGVITPRRGFSDYSSSFSLLESERIDGLLEYKDTILVHYNDTLKFESNSVYNTFTGTYSAPEDGLRIKSEEFNGNFYFTSSDGIKKISALSVEDITVSSIQDAGGLKAIDLTAKLLPNVSGFLPAQSKVAYRVIFGNKDKNNILILGSPSSRYILTNISSDIYYQEKSNVTITAYASITASSYIKLFSQKAKYIIWFNVTGTNTAPATSETIGAVLVEVKILGLGSNALVADKIANELAAVTEDFNVTSNSNVVTIESTEIDDVFDIDSVAAGLTVDTIIQGSISKGIYANAEVKITIPQGASTDYFYQVYRTQFNSVVEGLTLSDIDPGDEMRLIYEAPLTSTDITNGFAIFEDITSESFRDVGANLYTNPISGEGILQSNDRPPIAKDIEIFKNVTFYSNTKTIHNLSFNILSVDDFVSGTTKFGILNKDGLREYTFVGTPEVTTLTCADVANTLETNANTSYIVINSANDERSYYLWFDKGTGVDPELPNKIGIRVELSDIPTGTSSDVASRIDLALLDISDFVILNVLNVLSITNINNGDSTDATIGTIGVGWSISSISGTGENIATQQVLLSGFISPALAIEETARSLVRVINTDPLSPVTASYLSTETSLPGLINLENRSVTDSPFFLNINDIALSSEFNPNLPLVVTPSSLTIHTVTKTKVTKPSHGLSTGQEVFVYSPNTTPAFSGKFKITNISVNEFSIDKTITVADNVGTNARYQITTSVSSDNLTAPNRLYFSKINQPEAVPIANYIDIGPKDEPIQRILGLRDNLFVFKTDGIYMVSGILPPNYNVRRFDNTVNLISPDSAVVLNNQIFCLTNKGVCLVTETGVSVISYEISDLISAIVNSKFNIKYKSFGISYESDKSYLLFLPTLTVDTNSTQVYRYHTSEKTWTRWTKPATCGLVKVSDDKLYIGDGTRPYIQQERKNLDRTDFSERNFTLEIGINAIKPDDKLKLSTVVGLEIGDVLTQTQTITIHEYNYLLRKLDIDNGLDDNDYESTLLMMNGDNISSKMNALNNKLNTDDSSGTITAKVFSTNLITLQEQFNTLIDELNNVTCDTFLKNYKKREDTIIYEAIILSIDTTKNEIVLSQVLPVVQGDCEIYKKLETEVQYQPIHYGDPSSLKQVSEVSIMFDQNNFYSASISFASDISQGFVDVDFKSKGVGYFGNSDFGNLNLYWGGEGNDSPFRTLVPYQKQKCRYLTLKFKHKNAREHFRLLGIGSKVRNISDRAYRK